MAKNKKEDKEEKKEKKIDPIDIMLAEISKNYGEGIARSGDDLLANPPKVIPFSPALDKILGGGIRETDWVLVSGIEKSCKTTSLLSFCANCQKPEYGERHIMILSAEHRLSEQNLNGIKDLKTDPKHLTFIESTKGCILSSPDFLNIGLTFLKNVPGGVLLIDSVSSLVGASVIEKGIGSSDFGRNNQNFTQFVDLAVPIVKGNKNIILQVAQTYANTSGYGKSTKLKIATKGKYQADIILEILKSEFDYTEGEDEPPTGQIQNWLCRKASLTSPMKKCTSYVKYGIGIDRLKELLEVSKDYGFISVAGGGWTTLDFLTQEEKVKAGYDKDKEIKIQGLDNTVDLLNQNPEWITRLEKSVQLIINPSCSTSLQQ